MFCDFQCQSLAFCSTRYIVNVWKMWNKFDNYTQSSLINEFYSIMPTHYNDVIMSTMASQITSLTIVCSTVYLGADQRKQKSSASLAFVWGIHRGPVNSPHKGPVTRKMFPYDDVIMPSVQLTDPTFDLWFASPEWMAAVEWWMATGCQSPTW